MGGVTNGKVLAFGGVEIQLPIFGPAVADVDGILESIIAVSAGDEFDVICIEEAVCREAAAQVIAKDEQYRAYDKTLGDPSYGLSHLGLGSIDVQLKCSSAKDTFDPAYYNGGSAVSSAFVKRRRWLTESKALEKSR